MLVDMISKVKQTMLRHFSNSVCFNYSSSLFVSYNPANIYLFKSTIETLEKGVKYVQCYTPE